jgi:glycerate-2-kinase
MSKPRRAGEVKKVARLAAPATTLALLLSDVVGDEPSAIASGPTAPDPTTLQEAQRVLERYGIGPPESISRHLKKAEETPKPGDPVFEGVTNVVCGGGRRACEAAAEKARKPVIGVPGNAPFHKAGVARDEREMERLGDCASVSYPVVLHTPELP